MKKNRHALIIKLIEQNNIATQEELLAKLLDSGIDVTQAPVSRDIKELRLIKRPATNGSYKYCRAESEPADEQNSKYYAIFSQSVIYSDCAQNICVVKCRNGTAQAACAALDYLNIDGVVGTIAGDDTIFVLCRDELSAHLTKEKIEKYLKI